MRCASSLYAHQDDAPVQRYEYMSHVNWSLGLTTVMTSQDMLCSVGNIVTF